MSEFEVAHADADDSIDLTKSKDGGVLKTILK
jgi:hypothetical protein